MNNNELNEQLEIAANIIAKGAIAALIMCALAAIFIHPAQGQSPAANADDYHLIPMSSISRDTALNISLTDQSIWWTSQTENWGWVELLYNFATGEAIVDIETESKPIIFTDCRHQWVYEDLLIISMPSGDKFEVHIDTGYLYWTLNGRTTCYPPNGSQN